MKNFKSAFLVLIFLISILSATSQWIPCQGIEGADTRDIILQDSDIFIVTAGNGIFKRGVSENNWDSASIAGSFTKIRSNGDALFCCGTMGSFYRTLDKGNTWQTVGNIHGVYDMETIDNVAFIGTEDSLLRSFDNGDSWISVQPSSISTTVIRLFAQEGVLFCRFRDVDSIFKSGDYGNSWTPIPLTGSCGFLNDLYNFNEILWLATDTSIYIYDEDLLTWHTMQDSLPERSYPESFFEVDNTLYCCTFKGLFYFDDQDSSWIGNNAGFESINIHAGCHYGDTIYVATGTGPFFKYEGSEWVPDYNNLFQLNVNQIFTVGLRVYALSNGKLYFSDDISSGFELLEVKDYCLINKIVITDSAWFSGSDSGFSVSVDSGITWKEYSEGLEGKTVRDIALTDSFYFARVSSGLYRTRIDSMVWERVPNNIGTANVYGVEAINNVVFASVYGTIGIYRSTDYGTTFYAVPEADSYAPDLFVKDDLIFILGGNGTVLVSYDFGNSWQPWLSGLAGNIVACMDLTDSHDTTLLGGAIPPYVDYYLTLFTPEIPMGMNIRDNLPSKFNPWISHILFSNGRLFVAPNNYGLWYRDDLMVGVKDHSLIKDAPSGSLLLFPNPVSDFLTIDLQENGDQCDYLIFDQLGSAIKRNFFKNDNSKSTIDVSGLRQGVYFIVIRDNKGGSRAGKFVKVD